MNLVRKILFLMLIFSLTFGKDVPSDSLLHNPEIPVLRKFFILPVNVWQKLSFSSNSLNCQFEPSCSQFMAISMARFGVIPGTIIGADRIIRCNPAAHFYHTVSDSGTFHTDGRLYDDVPRNISFQQPDLRMTYCIIPGLSRVVDRKPVDGFYSFLLTFTCGYASYRLYGQDKYISSSLLGIVGLNFWFSDFYNFLKN